jgi:hypothetical protein
MTSYGKFGNTYTMHSDAAIGPENCVYDSQVGRKKFSHKIKIKQEHT